MARRPMTFSAWMKRIGKAVRSPDDLGDLGGMPVDDVATKLSVSKQRVHQLIDCNALDALEIQTMRGRPAIIVVTQASFDHYLAHRRAVPYGDTERFTLTPDAT